MRILTLMLRLDEDGRKTVNGLNGLGSFIGIQENIYRRGVEGGGGGGGEKDATKLSNYVRGFLPKLHRGQARTPHLLPLSSFKLLLLPSIAKFSILIIIELPISILLLSFYNPTMLSRTPRAFLSSIRPTLRIGRVSAPAATYFQSQPKDIQSSYRPFHTTPAARKGIQPDSSDPKPPKANSNNVAGAAVHVTEPSPLTPEQYYEYSEHYLNVVITEVERLQEEGSDMEAEYSVSPFPPGDHDLPSSSL